ncbi:hypothetical protein BT67DRAFT_435335 [Trichocladium antarcticum]|uniref:Uncharacterized protein n=1 Tax=Trichocladium antarcticum TaxID=1450529 RepID=A0AAN6UH36_9PEZI|nr:hypothetical protein BT67DRAFT_435335 [Trichocladium antarcticum]
MCLTITEVCPACEAPTGAFTLVKPCDDDSMRTGSAAMRAEDPSNPAVPCPNSQYNREDDQVIRCYVPLYPPYHWVCPNPNCRPMEQHTEYSTSTSSKAFLDAAPQWFAAWPFVNNPWSPADRESFCNHVLGAQLQRLRDRFVVEVCDGDDTGIAHAMLGIPDSRPQPSQLERNLEGGGLNPVGHPIHSPGFQSDTHHPHFAPGAEAGPSTASQNPQAAPALDPIANPSTAVQHMPPQPPLPPPAQTRTGGTRRWTSAELDQLVAIRGTGKTFRNMAASNDIPGRSWSAMESKYSEIMKLRGR